MKKIALVFSALILILTSCSSDDSTQFSTEGTLLKRATTSNGNVVIEDANYFYNGNKLTQIKKTETDYSNYIYTNDLITEMDTYKNNILISKSFFTYNNDNNLSQSLTQVYQTNEGIKIIYGYNLDGTVNITEYIGDLNNQNTVSKNVKLFIQNGLINKKEEYKLINGNIETFTSVYTYDGKNNPQNSITGYKNLMKHYYLVSGIPSNILSITYSTSTSENVSQISTAYTYNSNNFPVTMSTVYPSGETIVSNLNYQ